MTWDHKLFNVLALTVPLLAFLGAFGYFVAIPTWEKQAAELKLEEQLCAPGFVDVLDPGFFGANTKICSYVDGTIKYLKGMKRAP